MEQGKIVVGVAHDTKISKLTISKVKDNPGVAAKIFARLAEAGVNVDMIVQGASKEGLADISFTVNKEDAAIAHDVATGMMQELSAQTVDRDDHKAKVSIIGTGMITNPGVAAKMFNALAEKGINIEMISTSDINISTVIPESEVEKAVVTLHNVFELDK